MPAKRNRPGENIEYLNTGSAAIGEGEVVILGAHGIGVAGATIEPNAVGAVWVEGVFEFPKAAGAIALGAQAYWDNAAKTITESGTVKAGWVVQGAAAADATVLVKIS